MNQGFYKFKKRLLLFAYLKASALGLLFGALAFCTLFVLEKRDLISLGIIPIAAISLGAFALGFGLLLLLIYPTDKKVAVLLDDTFLLGESVRTMLAFKDERGVIIDVQRTTTAMRLDGISPKGLRLKRLWTLILCITLSAALLCTAFVVPAVAEPPEEDPIVDDYEKDWRIASLRALIQRVEADKFADGQMKEKFITELEGLISAVSATNKEMVMKLAAVAAVVAVDDAYRYHNTAQTLGEELSSLNEPLLKALGAALSKLDRSDVEDALADIADALGDSSEEDKLSTFNDVFSAALRRCTVKNTTEELYVAVVAFSNSLKTIADSSPANLSSAISDAAEELADSASDALLLQKDNDNLYTAVRDELVSIFGITESDLEGTDVTLPEDSTQGELTPPEEEEEEEKDPTNSSGGYGVGENLVGSDDLVYDPNTGEYRKYAEILNDYYDKYDSVRDEMDDELEDEVADYFDKLSTPENTNN